MELAYSIVFLVFSCNEPIWATVIEDDIVTYDGPQHEVIKGLGKEQAMQLLHDDFTVLHMIDLKKGCKSD